MQNIVPHNPERDQTPSGNPVAKAPKGRNWWLGRTSPRQMDPRTNTGSKLTAEQVLAIRSRAAAGEANVDIALDFPVSTKAISDIVRKRSWKNITEADL